MSRLLVSQIHEHMEISQMKLWILKVMNLLGKIEFQAQN